MTDRLLPVVATPVGADQPLWWTLRASARALTYHAARAVLNRAQAATGSNWTLHDVRHTAAYRMARDPQVSLADVQWVFADYLGLDWEWLTRRCAELGRVRRGRRRRPRSRLLSTEGADRACRYLGGLVRTTRT